MGRSFPSSSTAARRNYQIKPIIFLDRPFKIHFTRFFAPLFIPSTFFCCFYFLLFSFGPRLEPWINALNLALCFACKQPIIVTKSRSKVRERWWITDARDFFRPVKINRGLWVRKEKKKNKEASDGSKLSKTCTRLLSIYILVLKVDSVERGFCCRAFHHFEDYSITKNLGFK